MRRLRKYLIAMFVFALPFWGLSMVHAEESEQTYYHYYVNENETDLVEKKYEPAEITMENMIPEMLKFLNDEENAEPSMKRLLPNGVHINSYEIMDTHIRLDINEDYYDIPRSREVVLRKGIVKSFLQIPGIETLDIFIGGEGLKDSKGNLVGIMTEDSFLELQGNSSSAYRYDILTLYFTDETGTKLVPEERSLYYRRSLSRERVILEQLIKGTMEEGHYPVLPKNLIVHQLEMTEGIGYVNVSSAFVDDALPIAPEIPVYAVANSLIAADKINTVQIWVDGKEDVMFGDTMDLYEYYEWNQELIQEEK
ncbi:MAG: GerMN domain-containing protein [Eubacteriales bacterium]|nr:GerMN domain-containing protein [Eubacteriales bacterium]